ncbi:MAG: HNH endonuclease signature motif containing protein [Elusimicrobia bacterium]|nr:HNH endonuclease signature motif containing protein [Elusimicrobiota bacterium]
MALDIHLAHILAGGYSERLRRLPKAIREAVFSRDKGRCRICGEFGEQIDHIRGDSSKLSNLQLLCFHCHNKKTTSGFVKISSKTHPKEWKKRKKLLDRVRSFNPYRLCDRPEWNTLWQTIRSARRDVKKKIAPNRVD